ncbi:hypothetical protein CVT24_000467 [Panaeolus cyanescens]|uniref:RNA exonuclease 4 n=1 Tax=Panaeolus cyanescens TaxID=181874 RepID=A0A409V8C5_9AGAR|nr:hypothetical protein CVT24_000467 [Panaeolus cyanescens]
MAPPMERFVALSCINVGVGPGGTTNLLARVALVDYRGDVIFEKYVKPTSPVTDFRTAATGITPELLSSADAWTFDMIQQHVANLLVGKILVGHCLWNDLAVLGLPHPTVDTRDVALYMPFRNALKSTTVVGLRTLLWLLMNRRCQEGQLHPVENARASLDLYRSEETRWEMAISSANWPCLLPPSTFSRCYL